MTVVRLITIADFKKLLDRYDDDMGLDFGDFEFQGLRRSRDMMVKVKLKEITDYIQHDILDH